MNEQSAHKEEQQEPQSAPHVFYISWRIKEQIGENWDDTLFSLLAPFFYQATKTWMVFKVYIFVVVLPFQGDINKIWTE